MLFKVVQLNIIIRMFHTVTLCHSNLYVSSSLHVKFDFTFHVGLQLFLQEFAVLVKKEISNLAIIFMGINWMAYQLHCGHQGWCTQLFRYGPSLGFPCILCGLHQGHIYRRVHSLQGKPGQQETGLNVSNVTSSLVSLNRAPKKNSRG